MSTNRRLGRTHTDAALWVFGLACGAPILAAVVMAGMFMTGSPGFANLQQLSPVSASLASGQKVQITIVTNSGPQHDWPAYVPSAISIPADRSVTITVTNLDGATPLPSSLRTYSKVAGVIGNHIAIVPIRVTDSTVATGRTRDVNTVNSTAVSHTFTIPSLGINVPILADSRTSFTIRIAKPGTYTWECFDPCGSGPSGFGTPMSLVGDMAGTVTATAV